MYIKNIMIVLAGAVAKFIAIVPFFYLFVYIRIIPSIGMMNGIAKKIIWHRQSSILAGR